MWFFGSKQKNRIDELVVRIVQNKQSEQLEEELLKFDVAKLREKEKESWYEMYAVAAFRTGKRQEAMNRFQAAESKFPKNASIKFGLGQEYEYIGNIEMMLQYFRQATFPSVTGRHALAAARYAYLWNKYEDGLLFIEPVFEAYFKLGIIDDTFLYLRELPFFGITWGYYVVFNLLLNRPQDIEKRLLACKNKLKEYDFPTFEVEFRALQARQFDKLIELYNAKISKWSNSNWPNGYILIRKAILEARLLDKDKGFALLNSIVFSERDHVWLEDIRTLAKAELMCRCQDSVAEEKLIEEFLRKQPLLFEPDHALDFHLLEYQEKLKKIYRDRKTNNR